MEHGIESTIGGRIIRPRTEEYYNHAAKPHSCCAPEIHRDELVSQAGLDTACNSAPK